MSSAHWSGHYWMATIVNGRPLQVKHHLHIGLEPMLLGYIVSPDKKKCNAIIIVRCNNLAGFRFVASSMSHLWRMLKWLSKLGIKSIR